VWQGYGQGPKPPQWTDWPEDVNQYIDQAGNWYRQGGQTGDKWPAHLVWNRRLGFQNYADVLNQMKGGQPIGQWDLTPHMDWWEDYNIADWGLDPANLGGAGGQGGQGGGTWTGNWQDYFTQPQGDWGQGWAGGFQMPEQGAQGQGFQYPWQWGQASDVYSRFAGGLPTSTEDWWQAQQAPFERTISDQAKQLAEQMGLGGLRYSTPMGYGIADITGRETGKLYGGLAERQLGLTEAAKDRGMMAAGGLAGMGQQYLQAPQDWAQRMYGMGAGMTGLGQSALDRAYQDWSRTTPEMNPWLAQAMGFAGMQNQMMPQQYQPSFLSQILGFGSGMLPFIPGWGGG
jgi:hypothetical protein